MKRFLRFGIPVLIILLAFVIMRFFLGRRDEPARRRPHRRELIVTTQVARPGPVTPEIRAYGRARSAQPLELFSEVSGVIEGVDLPFRPGRRFTRGDLLLRVDDRPLRLSIASRKSELLSALAGVLPDIRLDFPELYPTWQDYFASCDTERPLADLPPAKNEKIKLLLARYRIYQLYYGIREQEIVLSKHRIASPFAGVVLEADLREGATVRTGSRLGLLVSSEEMEVELSLPARDLAWIDSTREVRLRSAETGGEWRGLVARIGGAIDEGTQTVPIYLSLMGDAAAPLLEGTFLEALLPGLPLPAAQRLPQQALHGEDRLYLIEDGRLALREVEVARREDGTIVVTAGLAAGDSVVTDLLQGVAPGMPARARSGGEGSR